MFVEITNESRDYAWGSPTLIPELLGVAPDGRPHAELWLGTHPGSPARVVGRGGSLRDGDRRHGDLRDVAGELPFLLKILAALSPLSLQAHPTTAQAGEGFVRENAAGIPLDSPARNYKDPYAKPEMLYALSDEFRALCGFRPVAETRAVLDAGQLGLFPELQTDADIRPVFEWLLSGHPDVASVVEAVSAVAARAEGEAWATARGLVEAYPGDPGIAISLLLHTVVLRRGEALYLPAGNLHSYQSGLGIELMGPSDNVLRGGLTPKYVDVPELLRVVDFTPVADPRLVPDVRGGVATFAPAGAGWELRIVDGGSLEGGAFEAAGPAVAVVLEGTVAGLTPGRAAFVDGERLEVPVGARVAVATAV